MLRNTLLCLVVVFAPWVVWGAESTLELPARGNAKAGASKIATCAACHGQDGIAAQPSYPNLAGQHYTYLLEQMHAFKSSERQAALMNGQLANKSSEDLMDIAAYYAEKDAPVAAKGQGRFELGERIYRAGLPNKGVPACTGCHSPQGHGNAAAAFPWVSGQPEEYVISQLKAYRSGERKTDAGLGGIMRDVADGLDDEEISALASYLRSLH